MEIREIPGTAALRKIYKIINFHNSNITSCRDMSFPKLDFKLIFIQFVNNYEIILNKNIRY